ncbi:MAG: PEP-CTERM sorting domain-containing protein [Gammaproteobacteria bacterium]
MTARKLIASIAFAWLTVGTWAGPIFFDDQPELMGQGIIEELQDFALPEVQDALLFQGFLLQGDDFLIGLEFTALDFVHTDSAPLGSAATAVPEPPVMLLLMLGMLCCGVAQRKQQMLRETGGKQHYGKQR